MAFPTKGVIQLDMKRQDLFNSCQTKWRKNILFLLRSLHLMQALHYSFSKQKFVSDKSKYSISTYKSKSDASLFLFLQVVNQIVLSNRISNGLLLSSGIRNLLRFLDNCLYR